jgi:hypothetical protein
VFVSHGHPDHLDPVVYDWRNDLPGINYVVSNDLPIGKRGRRIGPGEEMTLTQDLAVRAYDSTDLGVSFLVTAYGMTIFHAGDLNLWHWRRKAPCGRSGREEAFYALASHSLRAVSTLRCSRRPRRAVVHAGANHFILTRSRGLFIPMHWQDRPEWR